MCSLHCVLVRRCALLYGVSTRCVLLFGVVFRCAVFPYVVLLFGVVFRCAVFLCVASCCAVLCFVVRCFVLLFAAPPVRSCTPERSPPGLGGVRRLGGRPEGGPSRATVGYKKGASPSPCSPRDNLAIHLPTIHRRDQVHSPVPRTCFPARPVRLAGSWVFPGFL